MTTLGYFVACFQTLRKCFTHLQTSLGFSTISPQVRAQMKATVDLGRQVWIWEDKSSPTCFLWRTQSNLPLKPSKNSAASFSCQKKKVANPRLSASAAKAIPSLAVTLSLHRRASCKGKPLRLPQAANVGPSSRPRKRPAAARQTTRRSFSNWSSCTGCAS
ncbi:hypothetical protein RvY_18008-1 [Ramazzottius varieornatus]|uniref:Uncharacterized protein n=1 Tax=Ramazzottius varieornatus TaxID=947166 RepID=A0A1D1W634_RAMVA|nr:hypothetical protein RvY_18008-1 [Ramazzottius varieornatus]